MPTPDSSDLLIALGAVVKRLKHRPLPEHSSLTGMPFAPRHISTLLQIAQAAPLGMTELAERMNVSLATVSQVVTDLEEWGLVERTTDPADRRRTLVNVAAAHRPTTRLILEQRLRPLDRALRRLEPDERTGLIRGLGVLAEELDRNDKNTPAAREAGRDETATKAGNR
jgi:DNA-binding MarR family transcriptional regulator